MLLYNQLMPQDSLFLNEIFDYSENPSPGVNAYNQNTELQEIPISGMYQANNWGFILFLTCFFIIAYTVSQRAKLLLSMANGLFRNKDRQSIFFEPAGNEFTSKILLGLQTVILGSLIFYCISIHNETFIPESSSQLFLFLGKTALALIVFFIYKFLSYSIIGNIFYKKEAVHLWNDNFFSIICLSGIVLFFPVLIFFYVKQAYFFCYYFILLYSIFILIFTFYKIYALFFHEKERLLYFILYLCAQEIIPLFLLYKVLVYL